MCTHIDAYIHDQFAYVPLANLLDPVFELVFSDSAISIFVHLVHYDAI